MYSSPGRRSVSPIVNEVAELAPPEPGPFVVLKSWESFPIGRPISAAELVLLPFPALVVARLNIWGNRALDKDEEPSGGCIDWKDSNSVRSAFRVRRNSVGFEELRSRTVGRDSPSKR